MDYNKREQYADFKNLPLEKHRSCYSIKTSLWDCKKKTKKVLNNYKVERRYLQSFFFHIISALSTSFFH